MAKKKLVYSRGKVKSLEEFKEMVIGTVSALTGAPKRDALTPEAWEEKYTRYVKNAQKAPKDL